MGSLLTQNRKEFEYLLIYNGRQVQKTNSWLDDLSLLLGISGSEASSLLAGTYPHGL
jgi:hypothetical protein